MGTKKIALFAVSSAIVISALFIASANAEWSVTDPTWISSPTRSSGGGGSGAFSGPSSFAGTQKVFLDFDTGTAGGDHVYTVPERDAITAMLAADYAPWDFTFSHTVVPAAPFATLTYNTGPVGGIASDVDFRNLDLSGSATLDVNTLLGGVGEPAATSANFVALSSTVGAHELGHLVGLRHGDSLGPIGAGLAPTGPLATAYLPAYPGPAVAGESTLHTMASPASVGQTLFEAVMDTYIGERAAAKLEFNEVGTVTPEIGVAHSTAATAQPLTLPTIGVPNTLMPGDANFGKSLFADIETITGSIGVASELDVYSFTGSAGDIFNVEVISLVPDRISSVDPLDTQVAMFMPDGSTVVPQGAGTAANEDEFESFDSILIDVVLPADGTYYLAVAASFFVPTDTGDYELYVYRFSAIPEPTTLALAFMCSVAGLIRLKRRGR